MKRGGKIQLRAAQIDRPMSIQMIDFKEPELNPGELLIKVKTVGICGTDLKFFDGSISYLKDGLLELPHIPGHEWVGEVVALKTTSDVFKVGDRVTGECHIGCGSCEMCRNGRTNICSNRTQFGILQDGGLAEYIVIPERAAYKIPDTVSEEEATLVEPLTVALCALDKLEKVVGSKVLVAGLGPIGLLVSKVASTMGAASVIGVDVDPYARKIGKEMGCDHVIDASEESFLEEIKTLTNGQGPDIVVEATGVSEVFLKCISMVRTGGQLSLIGLHRKNVEINANELITKDLTITGNMASARVWERSIHLIAHKKVDVSKIITHRYEIKDVEAAFQTAYYKQGDVGKVMISF